jgi:hypothetical protein
LRAFQENLPIAAPIEGTIESFRDFVRIVGEEFNVEDTDGIEPPESWRDLLAV